MYTDLYQTNNKSINKILSQLVDLNQLIHIKEKEKFIKNIFHGNAEDYRRTINLLNLMHSWNLAHILLCRVFSKRNINEYSKHAIRLSTIVFSRYYHV